MSLIRAKAIQMGYDATATNNFLIYQPLTPDGTFRIAVGNQGATTDIMTVTNAGSVTFAGATNFATLNFGSGSQTAPSLSPIGNTNTGVFFPATNTVGITTNGSTKLTVTSTGSVGIGATSPSQKLHLVGNLKLAGAQNGNVANLILTRTDTSWSINNETDLRFYFTNSDTDTPSTLAGAWTVNGLGISTTSPNAKLTIGDGSITYKNSTQTASTVRELINYVYSTPSVAVSSGLNVGFRYGDTFPNRGASVKLLQVGNSDQYGEASTAITFWTYNNSYDNGAERVRIDNTGNVGIGTNNPYVKLSVLGTILSETSASTIPNILLGSPGLSYGQIQNDGTGIWSLGYGATNATKGTPVLTWNASGQVGVGTSTTYAPKSTFTIQKNDSTLGVSSSCALNIWNSNGSYSGSGGFINFFSDSRGNYQTASIGALLNSSTTTGATGSLAFYTKGQESDALPTERMRISTTGNVGIGITGPTVPLDVAGVIRANQLTAGTVGGNYVIREIEQFSFGAGGIGDEYMLLSPNPSGNSDAYQIMGEIYSSRGSQNSGNSISIDEITYSRAYNILAATISARSGSTYTMFREIVSCTYAGNPWIAVKVRNDGGQAHNGIFFRGWIVGESSNTFKLVRAASLSNVTTIRQGQGVQPHFQSGGVTGVSNNFTIYLDQPAMMWKKAIIKMRGRHDGGNANAFMSTGISGVGGVNVERISTTNLCDGTSTVNDTGGGITWVKLNSGAYKVNNGIDWQGTFTMSNATTSRPTIDFVFVYTHDAIGVSKTTGAASYAGGAGTVWNYINFDWDLTSGTQNMWADWTVEYVY